MAADVKIPSTYPLTPPLTQEDVLSWLRLLRSRRVGISTFHRLMEEYGCAEAALAALPAIAAEAGVDDYRCATREFVEAELDRARQAGAVPLLFGQDGYPQSLTEIPDPPPVLWALGDPAMALRPVVALVGSRSASSLGTRIAKRLAAELGEAGFVVVSGLARGIDTAAHVAALETGTVAVMAGGVDVVYPAENAVLAQEIAERGLRLSEQPAGTVPQARHFPSRNRLVSGLALAVVVVEAAAKSGSLITARTALDQGREVMAVPGHPFDARAAGCNMLLRDGAVLVRGARDVIEALAETGHPAPVAAARTRTSPAPTPAQEPQRGDVRVLHAAILDRLGPTPVAEDQVVRDIAATAAEFGPAILDLELDGKVAREPGGMIRLAV